MKNNLIKFLLLGLLVAPSFAFGQYTQPIAGVSLSSLFYTIKYVFWVVAVGFALVCFVIAGILFMTAMGDPAKIKTARNAVIFGTVGIFVALIAYSIISIVSSVL